MEDGIFPRTKKNDHASKVNVLIFFIYAQKWQFWKKVKSGHSPIFSYFQLLFPKNNN